MIEQLGVEGVLPDDISRLEVLEAVVAFAELDHPFDRRLRARLQADYIERVFEAQRYEEGLALVDAARRDFSVVPEILAEILLLGANVHESLGEFTRAQELLTEGESLLESLPEDRQAEPYVPVFTRLVRAKILIHSGVPDQAAPLIESAWAIAQDRGLDDCSAMLLTAGTELARARGDWPWVIQRVQAALDAGPIPGGEQQDRARRELDVAQAKAFQSMQSGKDLSLSYSLLRAALDRIGLDDPAAWPAALTLCDLDLVLGQTSTAESRAHAVSAAIERAGVRPTLPIRCNLAGVRGRVALQMSESEAGALAPDEFRRRRLEAERALEDLLSAWRSVEHREGGVGFLHFDERRALLVTVIRLQDSVERSLELLLAIDELGSLAQRLDVTGATVASIEDVLVPTDGGILVYVPSAWGSLALSIDREGAQVWPLSSSDTWSAHEQALAREMQPDLARGDEAFERCRLVATALRDRLLPNGLDSLVSTWEEVVLVRTENVGRIPFEVLPLKAKNGAPLGLELATSYLPSLSVGLGLAERREGRPEQRSLRDAPVVSVLVGPLEEGPEVPRIPWELEDERRLSEPWPMERVEFVLEPERAIERLCDAGSLGVCVLEVYAHGVRDSAREQSQGIFLGGTQETYVSGLSGCSMPPMCLLLVCGAGAGLTRRGDDLGSHLDAAFLAGGADVVASSRRDLSFEASLALMACFHRELARGQSPSRALLAARRELASTSAWKHPAFHSNLTLSGIAFAAAPRALVSIARDGAPDAPGDAADRPRQEWPLYAVGFGLLATVVALALRRRAA